MSLSINRSPLLLLDNPAGNLENRKRRESLVPKLFIANILEKKLSRRQILVLQRLRAAMLVTFCQRHERGLLLFEDAMLTASLKSTQRDICRYFLIVK